MIAGWSGFNNRCRAVREQAREQNGRLQLCRCDRHGVVNAVQWGRMNGQRAEIAVFAGNIRAHFAQRLHDTSHRALLNGSVTVYRGRKRLTGENAAQQTGGCAGIAGVQQFIRRLETVQPYAVYNNFFFRYVDGHTHFLETGNGRQTIFSHQETGNMRVGICQSAEHDSAVRDGLVARNRYVTAQRLRGSQWITHAFTSLSCVTE